MTILLHSLCGADNANRFSPHCWKVIMALDHKGLAFEERAVPFTEVPNVEDGASKTVPVIRDGSKVVADSFMIAAYLEETYPDRPSLFGGEGGEAMARFVEGWCQTQIHGGIAGIAMKDVHDCLAPKDQAYFRASREKMIGRTLEAHAENRAAAIAAFPARFEPLRFMLKRQPFIGGVSPLFPDYIVFGALKWLDLVSGSLFLPADDPVADWYARVAKARSAVSG